MNDNRINKETLEMPILENGLDFIMRGVNEFENESTDSSDLKYAVLNIYAGIELVLKARLEMEQWELVFNNIKKADKSKYKAGDFVSVYMDEALKRLENSCGVDISDEFKDDCNGLRKKRNVINHFQVKESKDTLVRYIVKSLVGILNFISENIRKEELNDSEKNIFDSINKIVIKNQSYIDEKLSSLCTLLSEYSALLNCHILNCPKCGQKTVVLDENKDVCECFFCQYVPDNKEEIADEYVETVLGMSEYGCAKDGAEWPVEECPDCGSLAFINGPEEYFCLECGTRIKNDEISHCCICGQLISLSDDDSTCPNCLD